MPRKDPPDYPTVWYGGGQETECGAGSMVSNFQPCIDRLPEYFYEMRDAVDRQNGVLSVVDLGCGDMNFAKHTILPLGFINYHGVDFKERDIWDRVLSDFSDYPRKRVVSAEQFDICDESKELWVCDVCLARDVFIHLPTDNVISILSRMQCKYMVSTIYVGADNFSRSTVPTPEFQPLDLRKPPFNLPEPFFMIPEHAKGKYLAGFDVQ